MPYGRAFTLSSLQSKDLHQIVFVPTGHSPSPDDAELALDLLQQAHCELSQPGQIVGGDAISQSALVSPKRHIEAPVQAVFYLPVIPDRTCHTFYI